MNSPIDNRCYKVLSESHDASTSHFEEGKILSLAHQAACDASVCMIFGSVAFPHHISPACAAWDWSGVREVVIHFLQE